MSEATPTTNQTHRQRGEGTPKVETGRRTTWKTEIMAPAVYMPPHEITLIYDQITLKRKCLDANTLK